MNSKLIMTIMNAFNLYFKVTLIAPFFDQYHLSKCQKGNTHPIGFTNYITLNNFDKSDKSRQARIVEVDYMYFRSHNRKNCNY